MNSVTDCAACWGISERTVRNYCAHEKNACDAALPPFIIDDRHKAFFYRGLKEWPKTPGYLRDTCPLMQDDFKAVLQYFGISVIS